MANGDEVTPAHHVRVAVVRHGFVHAETAFLQKPFTPAAPAMKVREVLDQGQP